MMNSYVLEWCPIIGIHCKHNELKYKYIFDPYTTSLTEKCRLNGGKRLLLEDRKKINESNQDLIQHVVLPAANRCICAENILKL